MPSHVLLQRTSGHIWRAFKLIDDAPLEFKWNAKWQVLAGGDVRMLLDDLVTEKVL